jgi:type IV secretion system protein VirB6
MAAPFQIFQPAYAFVDEKLGVFLNERAASVIGEVAGPLRAALVLYVILYGFAILRGSISEPIMDFAVRSLKLAFIYLLATTVAYSSFVIDPLFHVLPNTLARAAYLAEKIAGEASPFDFGPWILAALVYLVGALAAALSFGVVLIAKVALALLVALGPIFIACALFDATRRFFFGWLAQAVNYLVLFALIITIFQLVL